MANKAILAIMASILFVSVIISNVPPAEAVTWSPDKQITTDLDFDILPSIAVTTDGTIWVIWQSLRTDNFDLFYKISSDGGASWESETQLTTYPGYDVNPSILEANGKIWVFWSSLKSANNYDVYYKTSSDGGASWSGYTQLTTTPGWDVHPSVFQTSDGRIWVVWMSLRGGNYDIYYKVYNESWSSDMPLVTNPNEDKYPVIAQGSQGEIWVLWSSNRTGNFDLFYKISSDGGASWESETQLTTDPDWDVQPAIIRASDGGIWVFWDSDRIGGGPIPQDDIFCKTSYNNGLTWSSVTQVTTDSNDDWGPSIASLSYGNIAIAWASNRPDNNDIYFKTATFRDVSILSVNASPAIVREGEIVSINIVTQNQGGESETFQVDCLVDSTLIGQDVVTLTSGESVTSTFTWDTSGYTPGYCDISATATTVPDETDPTDNSLVATVYIKIPGDVTGDGIVDIFDLVSVGVAFGSEEGDPDYNPDADLNIDGIIDIFDAVIVAGNFGNTA